VSKSYSSAAVSVFGVYGTLTVTLPPKFVIAVSPTEILSTNERAYECHIQPVRNYFKKACIGGAV
jgi:hypothetical protein